MTGEIEYLLIGVLAAVLGLTFGGIGYGIRSRTQAAEAEGEKLANAFATIRDGPISSATEDILRYIESERQQDPAATIADLLAHAAPTEQLKVLERAGEKRVRLRNLSAQVKRLAQLASHLFIAPLIGFPAILLPLSLNVTSDPPISAVWYTLWALFTIIFLLAGLLTLYRMHNKKVSFEERLSKLKLDGAS